MTSPFEQAGFTTYRLPQAAQAPTFVANPAATAPAAQPAAPAIPAAPQVTPSDTFTPNINKDELKEELRKEILDEMKAEKELEEKEKAAEEKKKNKLGPIKRFKRFIGNVKKLGVTIGEYTKGFFKGAFKGGVIGGAVGGGIYALGKSKLLNNPETLVNTPVIGKLFRGAKFVSDPSVITNAIPTKILKNKATAIAVGGTILAATLIRALWKASLNANEKKALIEHKYESTPTIRK